MECRLSPFKEIERKQQENFLQHLLEVETLKIKTKDFADYGLGSEKPEGGLRET